MATNDDRSPEPRIELRGLAPRDLVSALDAIALSRGQDRNSLVIEVLSDFVDLKVYEVSVLHRALRGNPLFEDASREHSRSAG